MSKLTLKKLHGAVLVALLSAVAYVPATQAADTSHSPCHHLNGRWSGTWESFYPVHCTWSVSADASRFRNDVSMHVYAYDARGPYGQCPNNSAFNLSGSCVNGRLVLNYGSGSTSGTVLGNIVGHQLEVRNDNNHATLFKVS